MTFDVYNVPYVVASSYVSLSHVSTLTGVVISVCKPVFHDQQLQGVAAIDLRLADLLSSVTFFYSAEYSYVFIIDKSGRTLLHPLLPNPSTSERTTRAIVDISTLEPKASREGVISEMKRSVYKLSPSIYVKVITLFDYCLSDI